MVVAFVGGLCFTHGAYEGVCSQLGVAALIAVPEFFEEGHAFLAVGVREEDALSRLLLWRLFDNRDLFVVRHYNN